MPTIRQENGSYGEKLVAKKCSCPGCKRGHTLKVLPNNFKCADIICNFCGYLAQVKTTMKENIDKIPSSISGAMWQPQKERMDAGIFFPLFFVITNQKKNRASIFYLSADLQNPEIFIKRNPLKETAQRAGWQGFYYNIANIKERFIRIL